MSGNGKVSTDVSIVSDAPNDEVGESPKEPVVKEQPSEAPTTAAAPIITPRRRGQFMDFVPRASARAAPAIKRQAPTLQPTTNDVRPEEPAPSEDDDMIPVSVETNNPASLIDVEPATKGEDIPEAAEMVAGASQPSEQEESKKQIEPKESVVTDEPSPESQESTEPERDAEYSPFISDAKVDKRPLGEPAVMSLETLEKDLSTESAELKNTPPAVTAPLPVELSVDVAKLDSDTTAGTDEPSFADPKLAAAAPIKNETLEVSPEDTESAMQTSEASTASVVPAASPSPSPAARPVEKSTQRSTIMGSIAQQYTEQPSTGDQTTGSIYDTEQYHQPLQHPEKKKSGLAMIVWIIVFGLLGAAGAAGYFLLTMR